ncbi:MAG: sigma-70 family RNA polymerase sigma factor [Hyphomonadaceae bacterium]|nr:sigma-70 family RNA polymerase sigma factor [Hyphomonadaceae bacterium]
MKRRGTELEAGLEKAFRERRTALRDVARRAGEQDEEDVYQDAFVKIVERSRREEIPKLDNLLRHVVRCLTIDRFRRKALRQTYTSDEAGENAVDPAADPERKLIGAQRLGRVMSAIEAMPPRRREVFLLHRIEKLTYAQIARRLDVSIKAVEKHVHLAMRQLSDTDD